MPPAPTPAERPADLREALDTCRDLLRADYRRSLYPFQRITLAVWRAGQCLRYAKGPAAWIARRAVLIADLVWTQGVIGAELPHEVWAGPGLKLEHAGRGVILHPSVSLGSGVTMYHQVTIGVRDGRPAAVVEDDVFIGAGARILGPVRVGAGSRIGANAVVVKDTEPGYSYVGVPAQRVGAPRTNPA